jgi:cardiolipin synthase
MSAEKDMNWQNILVEVVDQRHVQLPPAWASIHVVTEARGELGQEVHASGRGREMASIVVSLLGQAIEKVVVSSFLLADQIVEDAILAAAKRGVRVYVLLASEARLEREEGEGEFDKRVLEQHKAMLRRLGGYVLFRSAPHFHAKVVVVDPDTFPAGILLTANLTSEALERNEELAVTLSSSEVVEVTEYLKWAMWESAEHELLDPEDRFKATRPLGKIPHPIGSSAIVATTAKANSIRDELLRLIDGAQSRIIVSSFGWDADHEVVRRLCARARDGLEITVLARLRPSSMAALLALAEAGASVVAYRWLHAKAIWTDSGQALVMSANLQRDGLDGGFELGVKLDGDRACELAERLAAWQASAPWRLMPKPKLGELFGITKFWNKGRFTDDAKVLASTNAALGQVAAQSADTLEASRPPLPETGDLPRLAHEVRCLWTVVAPVLAAKAKEVLRPAEGEVGPQRYMPPVFREPSGRLVVAVENPRELERARAVMAEVNAKAIVLAEGVSQ